VFDSFPGKITPEGHIISLGDNVHLRCTVEGGFPEVSNVTINCSSNVSTSTPGTFATLVLYKKDSRHVPCRCIAWHNTGCYNKKADIVVIFDEPGIYVSIN
jgi:hypothetical protein